MSRKIEFSICDLELLLEGHTSVVIYTSFSLIVPYMNISGQKLKEVFALRANPNDGRTDGRTGKIQYTRLFFFSKSADIN